MFYTRYTMVIRYMVSNMVQNIDPNTLFDDFTEDFYSIDKYFRFVCVYKFSITS